MEANTFSAGFAWDDVAHAATPAATARPAPVDGLRGGVSQAAATGVATHEALPFARDFVWSDGGVAGVAGVAGFATYFAGHQPVAVSQPMLATPVATPETSAFCGLEGGAQPHVAAVATVAEWTDGVRLLTGAGCPHGMSGVAWRELVMDARLLLQNWAPDLIALGWTTLEVFGVCRNPAARRLDIPGLVYMLRGRPVEAIDRDTALIRANATDTTTFRRTLIAGGGVPVWDWVSLGASLTGGQGSARQARYPCHRPKSTGVGV